MTPSDRRLESVQKNIHCVIKDGKAYRHRTHFFIEPKKTVLFINDGVCGYCPISLICWNNRRWSKIESMYHFYRCLRCGTFGFMTKQTNILHACFLLRNETHMSSFYAKLDDIPYACVTRCRTILGQLQFKRLPKNEDCEVILTNALENIVRY